MTDSTRCSGCGGKLEAGVLAERLCSRCLLKLGMAGGDTGESTKRVPGGVGKPRKLPDRIGSYRILDVLGEGGMGLVYLAEQEEPIRRRVALKVIKHGMDSDQVIARFETERQVLAIMNHPGVAKVFDAGTTESGSPYFVMEYVPGIPITQYCDLKCLPLSDRLELFNEVCEAIQHAHQKGIIHRDIKPSNVLVASEGNMPQLKVIDFGVAKATSQRLTERTLFTQQGILIGTPEYMSPEQAGTTALDVDTRTDIYSLGVLLYELLVGALPFDPATLRQAAAVEMMRIIREEDPPKPTARLSSLGRTGTAVARCRSADVRSLARQLRGELEWISMRALEKDPTRRYASASELAADVRRHLEDQPVLAGPPSLLYQIGKFVRRHRRGLTVTLLISVVTIVGILASATFRRNWKTAEDRAGLEAARNEGETAAFERLFGEDGSPKEYVLDAEEVLSSHREVLGSDDPELAFHLARHYSLAVAALETEDFLSGVETLDDMAELVQRMKNGEIEPRTPDALPRGDPEIRGLLWGWREEAIKIMRRALEQGNPRAAELLDFVSEELELKKEDQKELWDLAERIRRTDPDSGGK